MTGNSDRSDSPESADALPSATVWKFARASRASVVVDADHYFQVARTAMLGARRRIILIGWDFDARIVLDGNASDGGPKTVGEFILWLVNRTPELEVYLLRWDIGAMKAIFRGSTILTVAKWIWHPRIHSKLDGNHPTGGSHHQKIVVIDDCFAFCGGIDMTGDRWDTRAHRDNDPGRRNPSGKAYAPWHDATYALEGPAAAALGELCRDRWERAGCKPLQPVQGRTDCWPDALQVDFEDVEIAISRSEPEFDGKDGILEIEQLFLEQIANARDYIYAENQYFASRRIAEAIANRLDSDDCPEIVIVCPLSAHGWLEPIAMDSARARLVETLRRRDRHKKLRLYHPVTAGGEPIYVHAKIFIADDKILRVGSANFNNRSMRLDTECDLTIDCRLVANASQTPAITALRDGLLAEHLGVDAATVASAVRTGGSLIEAIEKLRATTNRLLAYEVPDLPAVEEWLAENEVLDPEGPAEMFEALSHRGLLRRLLRRT